MATAAENIAAAKRGERIHVKHSLHEHVKPGHCSHQRGWRTIECDNETDVVECPDCGEQKIAPCNFDEEYS